MINKSNQKWKRISVYDTEAKKIIHYDLNEKEKLIKKIARSKKVPQYIKEDLLIRDIHNNSSLQIEKPKLELSKNMTIFSRELFNNQCDFHIDTNDNINNLINDKIKIMDFNLVKEMVQNDYNDWNDFYLFR